MVHEVAPSLPSAFNPAVNGAPMAPPAAELAVSSANNVASQPRMRRILGAVATVVVAAGLMNMGGDTRPPKNPYQAAVAANPDCPADLTCVVDLAALGDNGCNYNPVKRLTKPRWIVEHITEGSLNDTLQGYNDPDRCISANDVVAPNGTVYETVPPDHPAYAAANESFNDDGIQVENVGPEDCSSVTEAEFQASQDLARYFTQRFDIAPSSATIFGHDSVPGPTDSYVPRMHIDPGVCWDWEKFLQGVGAPAPVAAPGSRVVMINPVQAQNHQEVTNCKGGGFKDCEPMDAPRGVNFLPLYSQPTTESPLLSDPYLHPDGSPGTTAQQDWGDKAPYGHEYVVAQRVPGWTAIWYGGKLAWFPDNGRVATPVQAAMIRTSGNAPVAIYGQPYPESSASAPTLTQYAILPGQEYVVADASTSDGVPADGKAADGGAAYTRIFYNHRFGYVRTDKISPIPTAK